MNNAVLIGRLTRDPELRYIPSGQAVTRFTLAVDKQLSKEKKAEFEQKGQPTADFINIVVWGRMAENCANYLAKGRLVAVNGRIQTSSSKDPNTGQMRYFTDVVAREVEFLEWGDGPSQGQNQAYNQDFNQTRNTPQNNNQSNDFSGIDGFDSVDEDNIPF